MSSNEEILAALGVAAVARPLVLGWTGNEPGPHWVELDVAHAWQQVLSRIDYGGAVPSAPNGSGAPVPGIDVLGIASAHGLHDFADTPLVAWGQQQMYMVGHEDVRVYVNLVHHAGFPHALQIKIVVLVAHKHRRVIVAALDHVLNLSGQDVAGLPCHGNKNSLLYLLWILPHFLQSHLTLLVYEMSRPYNRFALFHYLTQKRSWQHRE